MRTFEKMFEELTQYILPTTQDSPYLICALSSLPRGSSLPETVTLAKIAYNHLNAGELNGIQQQMTNPKISFRTFPRMQAEDCPFFEQEQQDKQKREYNKEEENTHSTNQRRQQCPPVEEVISSSSPQKDSNQSKKSSNHNFQKHAVVTIKKLMRVKYNYDGTQPQKLAHLMWNIFMSSGIKNKKILVILFGIANLQDSSYVNILKKCGFQEILEYGQNSIRQAQEILRARLNQSVTEQLVRENLSNCRNIKMSQQFLVYFLELLQSLRSGPLVKMRINDKTAKKIEAIIKAQKESP